MNYIGRISGKEYEIRLSSTDEQIVSVDGIDRHTDLRALGPRNLYTLIVDHSSYQVYLEKNTHGYTVFLNGKKYVVELENERARLIRSLIKAPVKASAQTEIKAPMPGLIVKVNVQEGQEIMVGESLVIIEAMKMENEIQAKSAGVVKKVFKGEKDSVEKGAVLMVIE